MTCKTKAAKVPREDNLQNPNELRVCRKEGQSDAAVAAELGYDPSVRAICSGRSFIKNALGEMALTESLDSLRAQIAQVQRGNLGIADRTLVAQANTLDAIFNELARRSALNMNEHLDAAERYMRLALKAQSQCRATLETLAAIKNPPVVFAKQANIANGPQQVNNSVEPSRARENESQQNKLSGERHELLPDARASALTLGVNQTMEAVGAVNGTAVEGRQGEGSEER